jgi:hypothetical protein
MNNHRSGKCFIAMPWRSGVNRISGFGYEEARATLKVFLGRVVYALKRQRRPKFQWAL